MNPIAKEISSYLGSAEMSDEEFLEHYGMPRRSGRYPWGSGKDDYQHSIDFLGRIDKLKQSGWKETPENMMKTFGMTSSEYRMEKRLCNDERKAYQIATAKSLQKDGLGATEIGRKMGVRESTIRGWLKQDQELETQQCKKTADFLKKRVDASKYGMVDVGVGVDKELNISRERLDTALYILESNGYHAYSGRIPQLTNPNQSTTQKVLAVPERKHGDIFDYSKVESLNDYISRDNGETYEKKFTYPSSLDSKRIKIRYAEDGGVDKDGIVELRRGVQDLSLGNSRYAQVRILVDGTHYIKGMAVYADDKDLPAGVDVIFNTNKSNKVSKMDVLKKIKNDPENPFGSNIKDADQGGQYWYIDKKDR